jgi:hypothetical protein
MLSRLSDRLCVDGNIRAVAPDRQEKKIRPSINRCRRDGFNCHRGGLSIRERE